MPSPRRLLFVALLALAALGPTAPASLAAPADVDRYEFDATWCFDDVTRRYCFETDGFMHLVDTDAGRESATIHHRQRAVITGPDGYEASYTTLTHDRFIAAPDGSFRVHTVGHVRSSDGTTRCGSTTILRIVDYEVVIDRVTITCD